MKTTTKRQVIDKAQGMADYEHAVMVVGRYADGDYFIRAARDLDVDMVGADWMARYGLTYVNVVTPTGWIPSQPMSAEEILRAAIANAR